MPLSAPLSRWTPIGETPGAALYVDPQDTRIVIVWPHEQAREDLTIARANRGAALEYLGGRSDGGGVIVFLDRIGDQSRDAR